MCGKIFYDGCDEAYLGLAERCSKEPITVYGYDELVECFIKQGMTEEEAVEWVGFNIAGGWLGEATPLILYRVPIEEAKTID